MKYPLRFYPDLNFKNRNIGIKIWKILILIISMQLGPGSKLKSKRKWSGMMDNREQSMMKSMKRKNYTSPKRHVTLNQKLNID